jgi:hypothetical protein
MLFQLVIMWYQIRCDCDDVLGELWKEWIILRQHFCVVVSTKETHEISVRIASLWLGFIAGITQV